MCMVGFTTLRCGIQHIYMVDMMFTSAKIYIELTHHFSWSYGIKDESGAVLHVLIFSPTHRKIVLVQHPKLMT